MAEEFEAPAAAEEPQWGPKTIAFLAAIRAYPHVTHAAKAAEVSRFAHYRRLERNPRYRAAFEEAWAQGIEAAVDEAMRRAVRGISRPVLYHGAPVYIPVDPNNPDAGMRMLMETEYSDPLLLRILAAYKPKVFTELVKKQLTGEDGGPLTTKVLVEFVDAADPSPAV